jgi:hypothetical protein
VDVLSSNVFNVSCPSGALGPSQAGIVTVFDNRIAFWVQRIAP